MASVQAAVGALTTVLFYAVMAAALWKVFQIADTLTEIKQLLLDAQRKSTPVPPAAGPMSLESAEALLREVAAEAHAPQQK